MHFGTGILQVPSCGQNSHITYLLDLDKTFEGKPENSSEDGKANDKKSDDSFTDDSLELEEISTGGGSQICITSKSAFWECCMCSSISFNS